MKVSQFNRAKEIMASLEDLNRMKTNLSKNVDNAFTKVEDDSNSYSYDKKKIEKPIYPSANEFALILQAELSNTIESRIEAEKKNLNEELDRL